MKSKKEIEEEDIESSVNQFIKSVEFKEGLENKENFWKCFKCGSYTNKKEIKLGFFKTIECSVCKHNFIIKNI